MSRYLELLRQARRAEMWDEIVPAPRHIPAPPTAVEESGCIRILSVLERHWRWSAAFAVAVIITAVLGTALIKPVYQPQSRIEVDPPGAETFSLQNGAPGYDQADYLETQAQELQSDKLAQAVIHKLHLEENPEFVARSKVTKMSRSHAKDFIESTALENGALSNFREKLKVTRDSASRLITISFAAHDPGLAAQVTNTLVDLFIDTSYKERHEEILKSSEWLSKQLDEVRAKMEDSNRALAEFQKATGIAAIDENQSTFGEKMTELNRQLTQAQADRIQYAAFIRRLHKHGDSELPQLSSDPVIQDLTKKISAARADLAHALVIYGKNNPHAKELETQIQELQRQIAHQRQIIIGNLKTNYFAARTREQLLQSQINNSSEELSQMARYIALKKEAQARGDLYNQLYARVKEAGITAESKSANIRVVDSARVLSHPSRPNWALNMLAAFGAGLIGGLALAFVRDGIDRTLRSLDDVRGCTGLANISVVPVIGADDGLLRSHRSYGLSQKFVLDRAYSPESEALLALGTSLRLSRPDQPPQILLISSPFAGDGKTTVAVNLAITLARHSRTCLVDADMRKAGIYRRKTSVAAAFGVASHSGLGDVLSGSVTLEEVLVLISKAPPLVILPAGNSLNHPNDLIFSPNIHSVFHSLRERFDNIIVDTSPLLPFADARALARLVDGIVLVGRAGWTTKDALMRSTELLHEVHSAPVLEVVLNAAGRMASYYTSYRYH